MVASLVSLICFVMVLIPLFQESVGKGILGLICALYTFIWGWQTSSEGNRRSIMLAWTVSIIAGIIFNVLAGAASRP
jgi:hypothetical protein